MTARVWKPFAVVVARRGFGEVPQVHGVDVRKDAKRTLCGKRVPDDWHRHEQMYQTPPDTVTCQSCVRAFRNIWPERKPVLLTRREQLEQDAARRVAARMGLDRDFDPANDTDYFLGEAAVWGSI